jgi:SAM-dependent methyltransferase
MKRPPPDSPELHHADVVRREYRDPSRFAARAAVWARRTGPKVFDVAFAALLELAPRRVLEVGSGRGEFAARVAAAGIEVVAVDQSEEMVALARARGVGAQVGDVQALPFADGAFDVAVANFMLYHVPDLDRALVELARVAPALVAATNGYDQLQEMWALVGRDLTPRRQLFMRDSGEQRLRAYYDEVRMIDLPATIELSADDMRHYIANSVADAHRAADVPDFAGTKTVTASTAVFVASHRA